MSYRDALVQIRQEQRLQEGRRVSEQQQQETTDVSQPPSISQPETNAAHTRPTSSEVRSTSTSAVASMSTSTETRSTELCTMSTSEVALGTQSRSREVQSTSTSTSTVVTSREYISDKDLYEVLAMIVKLSESQVNKSLINCIVDYVSSKLNRSSEA